MVDAVVGLSAAQGTSTSLSGDGKLTTTLRTSIGVENTSQTAGGRCHNFERRLDKGRLVLTGT